MCLAIPGKILELKNGKTAVVSIMGATREVSVELLKNVELGEYLIIHAGCAIEKIDEEEAMKTIQLFKELNEAYNE